MVVDTLLLCFCEDCQMNDGTEGKEYYMSNSLMVRKNPPPSPHVKPSLLQPDSLLQNCRMVKHFKWYPLDATDFRKLYKNMDELAILVFSPSMYFLIDVFIIKTFLNWSVLLRGHSVWISYSCANMNFLFRY